MKITNKILRALLKVYLYAHYLAFVYLCFSFLFICSTVLYFMYPLFLFFASFPVGPAAVQLALLVLCYKYIYAIIDLTMSLPERCLFIIIAVFVIALKILTCAYFRRENIRVYRFSLFKISIVCTLVPVAFLVVSAIPFIGAMTASEVEEFLILLSIIVIYSFAVDTALLSYVKLRKALEGDEKALKWTAVLTITWTVLMWITYPVYSKVVLEWHEVPIGPPLKPVITITWTIITILQILIATLLIINLRKHNIVTSCASSL